MGAFFGGHLLEGVISAVSVRPHATRDLLLHSGESGQDGFRSKAEGKGGREAGAEGELEGRNGKPGILDALRIDSGVALFDGSHALVNRGDLGILLGFGEGMVKVGGVALIGEAAEEGGGIGGGHSFLKKRNKTNRGLVNFLEQLYCWIGGCQGEEKLGIEEDIGAKD
jgi:hypothetical protein